MLIADTRLREIYAPVGPVTPGYDPRSPHRRAIRHRVPVAPSIPSAPVPVKIVDMQPQRQKSPRCPRCKGNCFPSREDPKYLECLMCGHEVLRPGYIPEVRPEEAAPRAARTAAVFNNLIDDGCEYSKTCEACPFNECVWTFEDESAALANILAARSA